MKQPTIHWGRLQHFLNGLIADEMPPFSILLEMLARHDLQGESGLGSKLFR